MLTFFSNATDNISQNSLKEFGRIFTCVNFWPKIFFPSFPRAKYRIDRSFLSASLILIPLNRFVHVFIEAVSFVLGSFCLARRFRRPVELPKAVIVNNIFLSGSEGFRCRCSSLSLLPVRKCSTLVSSTVVCIYYLMMGGWNTWMTIRYKS